VPASRARPAETFALLVLACGALLHGAPQSDRNVAPTKWIVGRTSDGQPDLQGVWTNYDPDRKSVV